MYQVAVAGAGKIGSLISLYLIQSGDYVVTLLDKDFTQTDSQRLGQHSALHYQQLDLADEKALEKLLKAQQFDAVISSLPFFMNPLIAKSARKANIAYFDLTEDRAVTAEIKALAQGAKKAFVSQCGLAPGFVGIVAHHLMQHFSQIASVRMRVGALPANSNNALKYALTWSTEGLINEYCNPCLALQQGKIIELQALEGLELIELDGALYEAFNTSGGLGNLVELSADNVHNMDYKTIRYPGHAEKMKFLLQDMQLDRNKALLKTLLESCIPKTYQDEVIVFIAVSGQQEHTLVEETFFVKMYPQIIGGFPWSAIQVTTASSLCAVVDLVLAEPEKYQGFVYQEKLPLAAFMQNRFSGCFKQGEKQNEAVIKL